MIVSILHKSRHRTAYLVVLLNIISCFIFNGCRYSSTLPEEVNQALDLAAENRSELKKVLNHYRKADSQKFQAACFLISNMRYHKSIQEIEISEGFQVYHAKTDSLYNVFFGNMKSEDIINTKPKNLDDVRQEMAEEFNRLPQPATKENFRFDLEVISAQYLINHIDDAFSRWAESPLLNNIDFEEFKEFILPYRSTTEELFLSQRQLYNTWKGILKPDSFVNITHPLSRYKAYINKSRWINKFTEPAIPSAVYDLILPKFEMDCHNMTNWTVRILRSSGIPVVYEYTPQWKDRNRRHFWCVSPDSNGVWQPYTAPDNNLKEDWKTDLQYAGKVYRRTFGANKKTPYFMANESEYIPNGLSSPLLSDQTHRYHQTISLRLPFTADIINNMVYLCMFKGEELNPVGWGTVDRNKKEAIFEQLPLNTVFVPVYFDQKGEIVPFGKPFILQSDGIVPGIPVPLSTNKLSEVRTFFLQREELIEESLIANKKTDIKFVSFFPQGMHSDEVVLLRKYPEKRRLKSMREKLIGAVFTGSLKEKEDYDTLFTIDKVPKPYLQQIKLENRKAYRYYRFKTTDGSAVNIAHMEFLGKKGSYANPGMPSPLPLLSPSSPVNDDKGLIRINGTPLVTGSNPQYAYDGDVGTYVGASHIGMDFEQEVVITHVRFVPRTANNGIVLGHEYRLLFHDGHQWQVHSTQKAKENYLCFKSIPKGTLYWLRNITEGQEELVFTLDAGKQKFIHID